MYFFANLIWHSPPPPLVLTQGSVSTRDPTTAPTTTTPCPFSFCPSQTGRREGSGVEGSGRLLPSLPSPTTTPEGKDAKGRAS